MTTNYPHTTPGELKDILNDLVSPEARNDILRALKDAGIIKNGSSRVDFEAVDSTEAPSITIGKQVRAVVLGADTQTDVRSSRPIVIAASSGDNYIDITPVRGFGHADTVIGGSGTDTIIGNGAADLLMGGSGQELIESGGGKDSLVGGSGSDTLTGGGQSLIYGGSGDARIKAGQFSGSHDTIYAGTGQDTITLKQGDNTVYGPNALGAATIKAGSGHDTIFGGSGPETITGGAHTTIHLGSGPVSFDHTKNTNDTIYGGASTGSVNLNVVRSDVTISRTHGTDQTKIAFAGGGSITTVGTVNLVFSDHTKKTVT